MPNLFDLLHFLDGGGSRTVRGQERIGLRFESFRELLEDYIMMILVRHRLSSALLGPRRQRRQHPFFALCLDLLSGLREVDLSATRRAL